MTRQVLVPLQLPADPANPLEAATKQYVDARATTICTSTTRPGAPYTGQNIYETDTKRYSTWDGSAWVVVSVKPTAKVLEATVNQAVGSGTFTLWAAGSTTYDTGDFATPANGHFTIPITGLYNLNANVTWIGSALAGRRILQIENYVAQALGTGTNARRMENVPDATSGQAGNQLTVDLPLTAGDQIRAVVWQNVSAPYNIDNVNFKSSFSIKRVA